MDPITHLVATAVLVGRQPGSIIAGLAPDLPFYATYPVWWLVSGRRTMRSSGELALPPAWLRQIHYASHSLLMAALLVALVWRRDDRRRIVMAWLLHLALDIPSHSRERMAPRLFWPLSDWAHDGRSWSDEAWKAIRHAHNQKRRRLV